MTEIKKIIDELKTMLDLRVEPHDQIAEYEKNLAKKQMENDAEKFGLRYALATFENYQIYDDRQIIIVEKCREYAEMEKNNGESLLLMGSPGTGKDHLMVSVIKKIGKPFLIRNWQEIVMEKLDGDRWSEKLYFYSNVPILYIAELAEKALTIAQKELLSIIIDNRYKKLLPVLISTNLDWKNLEREIDIDVGKTADRFKEIFHGRALVLNWDSYRGRYRI